MNIQAEKLELMRLILETDNPSVLESIKKLFKAKAKDDFWDTLSQVQKDEILEGMQQINEGEVVDFEEFMKQHRK